MDIMNILSKPGLESKHLSVCRCCLKEDGLQDIPSEYIDSGEKGTYEQMLKNTFDIQVSHSDKINSWLICSQCIVTLQAANAFKQMVLQSEKTFLKYLLSLECDKGDVKPSHPELVEVIIKEESTDTNAIPFDMNFQDNDSLDDDETLANLKVELSKTGAIENPRKRKRSQEKKSKSKRCKIKEKSEIESSAVQEKDWSKVAERRGSGPLLRENSLKLIQNSTLCVFQWNKSRYRCFCCKEPFSDINLLREHTFNSHTLGNIEKKIIFQQNRLVKAEISTLHCKLCREKLEGLSNLKQHLSRTHSIQTSEDLLVPFKIESELKCQICYEKFTIFRLLNIHMNKHYQKQVCHICGAGFSNLVFLNLHRTRSHRPFHCKPCKITFKNKTDKKHHDISIHEVKFEIKRFPCPFCSERFSQENIRVRHLVEHHGMPKPDFKCNICPKTFLTKSLVNNHVKNVHQKERNQECDICHNFFYTKSDLVRHRVTHTGERNYSCEVCTNRFASRDSLRRHMKRSHAG